MASVDRAFAIVDAALKRHADKPAGGWRNWEAAKDLKARRNDPKARSNEDLALAEHYLVARAFVSTGKYQYSKVVVMVVGYYGLKMHAEHKHKALQVLRHNVLKPVTSPDHLQVSMGLQGAKDGAIDLRKYGGVPAADLYDSPTDFFGTHPGQ